MNKLAWTLVAGTSLLLVGCGSKSDPVAGGETPASVPTKTDPPAGKGTETTKGLKIEDTTIGTGQTAATGDYVEMQYTGTLINGTEFDSNAPKGGAPPEKPPFGFTIGQGSVIKGWDLGVPGMKVGGVRKLTIAPELAYGSDDKGNIPPNSTLLFTVKLLAVVKPGEETIFDHTDEKVGTGPEVKTGDLVTVDYVGSLSNGLEFGSSKDDKKPLKFFAGTTKVPGGKQMNVKGVAYGVLGMKKGGVRDLVLPSAVGFAMGSAPQNVPPTNVLHFKVTLLSIQPGSGKSK